MAARTDRLPCNQQENASLPSALDIPRQEDPTHRIVFKVQFIIIQAIFSRKSMKKFAVTDKTIFRVCKALDGKK